MIRLKSIYFIGFVTIIILGIYISASIITIILELFIWSLLCATILMMLEEVLGMILSPILSVLEVVCAVFTFTVFEDQRLLLPWLDGKYAELAKSIPPTIIGIIAFVLLLRYLSYFKKHMW